MENFDKNQLLTTFAQNLKKRRKRLKLTQEALAALLGCHENHITNLESGKTDPMLSMVVRLSLALKMPIQEFLKPN